MPDGCLWFSMAVNKIVQAIPYGISLSVPPYLGHRRRRRADVPDRGERLVDVAHRGTLDAEAGVVNQPPPLLGERRIVGVVEGLAVARVANQVLRVGEIRLADR